MAYAKVEETFWHDPKVRALSERARNFFLYLLTSPHRNRVGCFVLDPFYAAADIQWSPDAVTTALQELERAGRVAWDPETRVVLIRRFLKFNTLENGKVVVAAIRELTGVPDTPLLAEVLAALEQARKHYYRPLIDAVAGRIGRTTQVHDTASHENRTADHIGNGMAKGMAFPGPDVAPGPGTSPLPDKAPDRSRAVAVRARAPEPAWLNGSEPHDQPASPDAQAQPEPRTAAVEGPALGEFLEGFPEIAALVSGLKHEGGAKATAATIRHRFLFPDDEQTLADPVVKALPLDARRRLVHAALLEYATQPEPFSRPHFTGFVRRIRDQETKANGSTPVKAWNLPAPAPEQAPPPEERAEVAELAATMKQALKNASVPEPRKRRDPLTREQQLAIARGKKPEGEG